MSYAKSVVDKVFYPTLKRQLDALNEHLKTKGLRAGVDVQWFFDVIEKE